MAVRAIGQYALFFGTQSASLVEFELKKCFSWLAGDRNEQKLIGAVRDFIFVSLYFSILIISFYDLRF